MEASKTSRFGKKAMSLFLSGAMVVAFAPAVAAPAAQALTAEEGTATSTKIELATGETHLEKANDAKATVSYVSPTSVRVSVTGVTAKENGGTIKYKVDLDGKTGDAFAAQEGVKDGDVITVTAEQMGAIIADGGTGAGAATFEASWSKNEGATAADLFAGAEVSGVEGAGAKIAGGVVELDRATLFGATDDDLQAKVTEITLKADGGKKLAAADNEKWEKHWTAQLVWTADADTNPVNDSMELTKDENKNWTAIADKAGLAGAAGRQVWLVVTGAKDSSGSKDKNDYEGLSTAIKVKVVGTQLTGAFVYEKNAKDASDVSDISFVYNGADQTGSLGIAIGDKALKGSGADADYEVQWVDGNMVPVATTGGVVGVTNAGKYKAVVTGKGDYTGTVTVDFEIKALDLSTAEIEIDRAGTGTNYSMEVASVTAAGEKNPAAEAVNDLLAVAPADGNPFTGENGSYNYTVALKAGATDAQKANVTGTGSATYATGTKVNIGFVNGKQETGTANNDTVEVRLDKSAADYAPYNHAQFVTNDNAVDSTKLVVKVKDAETGADAAESSLGEAGTWTVEVSVDGEATGWTKAGKRTFTFVVKEGDVNARTVAAKYKGELFQSNAKSDTYTGQDLSSNIEVTAADTKGKALVAGTDFAVKITDKDGKEASEIVDAGAYTITVTGKAYELASAVTFTFTVDKVTPTGIVANPRKGSGDTIEASKGFEYTGSVIDPKLQFYKGNTTKNADRIDVPAEAYKVTKIERADITVNNGAETAGTYKEVKEIKDAGFYKLTVKADQTYAGKDNYGLGAVTGDAHKVEFKVSKAPVGTAVLDGEETYVTTDNVTRLAGYKYTYTGEAIVPQFTLYDKDISDADAKAIELAEGDLKVEVTKKNDDNTWSKVDGLKEVGTYKVKYTPESDGAKANLAWTGTTFDVEVAPTDVAYIDVDPSMFTDKGIIAYTGKAIAPQFRFWTSNPALDAKAEQLEPGAGSYKVSYRFSQQVDVDGSLIAAVVVDEVKEVGYYQPLFLDTDEGDEFGFGTVGRTFQVAQASDATKVTKMTQKISKITPASKTVKGVKKGKLKAKKTFKVKAAGAKTAVTFAKANKAGGSKIAVSKAGKVTVKKGTKKGTYKVKVKATAKATATYKAATKTVTVKITVK